MAHLYRLCGPEPTGRHTNNVQCMEEVLEVAGEAEDPIPPEEIAEIMHWVVYIRINSKT